LSTKKKTKKIQEEYSMYDEEARLDDDDELEDIQEEPMEEDSDDSYKGPGQQGKKKARRNDNETQEEKNRRIAQKEELKILKTQMLTMKDQLAKKTNKIEEIKTTLKKSQHVLVQNQPFGNNPTSTDGKTVTKYEDGTMPIKDDDSELNIQKQKSFIGGVPTDNIIEALDEEEDLIEKRLRDINEAVDPERDALDIGQESDQDKDDFLDPNNGNNSGEDDFDDYGEEEDDGMDNGIKNQTDP